MKISLATFIFAFALVVGIHSARDERFIGRPLPGIRNLIEELENKLSKGLDRVTGLTEDQREELRLKLAQKLIEYPNSKDVEFLKPSQLLKYLKEVRQFASNAINELIEEAKTMKEANKSEKEEDNVDKRQSSGPYESRIGKFVDGIVRTFKKKLDGFIGLTTYHVQELLREFKEGIVSIDTPNFGWFWNPLEWGRWTTDVVTKSLKLTATLVARAFKLTTGIFKEIFSGVEDIFGKIADLTSEEILSNLENQVKNALDKISNLKQEDKDQLIKEFKDAVSSLANQDLKLLNPQELAAFIKQLKDLTYKTIEDVVTKAQELAKDV